MDLTNPQVTLRQARIEELEAELAAAQEKIKELETYTKIGYDQVVADQCRELAAEPVQQEADRTEPVQEEATKYRCKECGTDIPHEHVDTCFTGMIGKGKK